MRYLFYGLLTLVCLAVAGLTFIFVAGPTDLLRDQLVDAVNARTGRDLTVAGSSSLSIYPQPGLILHDVTLSDPPAMGAAPFVRIARLEIEMPFSALMRQQLVVRKVVLHGAVVDLRADAAGRRNWEFAAANLKKAA